MSLATETELKFELDAADVKRVLAHPLLKHCAAAAPERLTSVYFDTDRLALREAGVSLRVRHAAGARWQTIKGPNGASGVFRRAEWERQIDADWPDPGLFGGTPVEDLAADGDLRPVFETRVDRTVHRVGGKGWEAEVSLDRGEVDTGAEAAGFVELEIELKRGAVSHLFDVARTLNAAAPLRLVMRSKAARGYALLDGGESAVTKAAPVPLRPVMTCEDAFRAIGRECLRHLTVNAPILIASGDPQAVHQVRVAVRRLRAALSLFGDLVRDGRIAEVKAELKWIADGCGAARDLDVFIRGVLEPLRRHHPSEPGMAELGAYFEERRSAAFAGALDTVRSPRFNTAVLETVAWIEAGPWMADADWLRRTRLDRPVEKLAAAELSRRARSVRRKGRNLADLDAPARHKLRIRIKKLRYAAEFFGGLYAGKAKKRRKRFLAALEELQGCLGELNDLAVNHDAEVDLARRPGRKGKGHAARRAFAAGMVTGHQSARVGPLMEDAAEAYGRFRRAKRFW